MENGTITVNLNVKIMEDEKDFERRVNAQKELIGFEMDKMENLVDGLIQKWIETLPKMMENM